LQQNQFGTYFKYALGEIVLVVAGILIAVALNNWNEARKIKEEIANIQSLVKADLSNDIVEIDKILGIYKDVEDFYQKHLNGEVTAADYEEVPRLKFLILGYPELSLNQRGYNLLKKFSDGQQKDESNMTSKIIAFYTEMLHEVKVDDDIRRKNFDTNFTHWQLYPWWSDYISGKSNAKFIQYALTDQDYRNRVATAQFINYKVFKPEIEEYKSRAKQLIEKIK